MGTCMKNAWAVGGWGRGAARDAAGAVQVQCRAPLGHHHTHMPRGPNLNSDSLLPESGKSGLVVQI